MRKVIYSKNLSSYFYIQRLDEQLLVISIGSDSPFEFMDILVKTVQREAESIHKNEIVVYFDLLSCVGNNENRYQRIFFNKKYPDAFIDNIINLRPHELPFIVSQELKKFYTEHLKEALLYSILSNKEKAKLSASSIV